ncbi:MAG: hypothetical protein ACON4U_19990 [Myxococcota bacterium]
MPDLKIDTPISELQIAITEQPNNSWLPFALGYRLLSEEDVWNGELCLLQSAQQGNHHAAAYFAYQKLGLAELETRLHNCTTADEAQSLLHRQTPLQFIDIPSCRLDLQNALHDLIGWATSGSPLAQAIDALQCAVAGDRSAIERLQSLSSLGQPQARQWLFLLNYQNALEIDEVCDWLAPFLHHTWAQRWIGSAFLKRNEPKALEWLWQAARNGDSASYQLIVNQLSAETHWDDIHFQALAELMQHESSEAYQLAAQMNNRIFSKLQLHYLKVAHQLGMDTTLNIRHTQSKIIGFTLLTLAAALICILVPDLPNYTAIFPLLFGLSRYFRDQKSDAAFLSRFDGIVLNLSQDLTVQRESNEPHFETNLVLGDEDYWFKALNGDLSILETQSSSISAWDLNGIKKWSVLWSKPPQLPWHQIWLNVNEETCILALSGAPSNIKSAAFAELSKANQMRFDGFLKRVGYVPLRLCQDAILTIQNLNTKETLPL